MIENIFAAVATLLYEGETGLVMENRSLTFNVNLKLTAQSKVSRDTYIVVAAQPANPKKFKFALDHPSEKPGSFSDSRSHGWMIEWLEKISRSTKVSRDTFRGRSPQARLLHLQSSVPNAQLFHP